MKKLLSALYIFSVFLHFGCKSEVDLIADGESDYQIFISSDALQPEQYAAKELQRYIERVSGVTLPITNQKPDNGKAIFIGFKEAPESILKNLPTDSFINEEYIIRSDGQQLLIAGAGKRGTLYGVIGYLADHLGVRWYTREVVKTPEQKKIRLRLVEDRQKPHFEYREAWYQEAYDPEWALHNRLNPSLKPLPDSLGGSYITYPFAHTFENLVPHTQYYKTNPEYFSLINGKRSDKLSQLCLTNPEVLKIATNQVFKWIEEHPEADIYSVDQNDGEGNCECDQCTAIDKAEGSPAGSLLYFINQIADTVAKVHPHVKLQTFAYAYTEIPPKNIRPADNLTIRLCHYNYCSAHSMENCENHKPFRERYEQWNKISKRISIWDYFTDFSQYLMPFPNFETVKNDIKWYADRGARGIFAQGNRVRANGGGEFSELRAWVFAQLMWNPQLDAQVLIDEFVSNVYGEAAPEINAYIRLMHDQVKTDSLHFSIWAQPNEVHYLGVQSIQQADSIFAIAKEKVRKNEALLQRVELAYLPVLYTKLYFYSIGGTAYLSKNEMPAAFKQFKNLIDRHQIKAIGDMEETYGNLPRFMEKVEFAPQFIKDWWVAGPFDNTDLKGLSTIFEPEKNFSEQAVFKGKENMTFQWKRYQDHTSGYIDFASLFAPNEEAVAYAYTTYPMQEAGTKTFGVGSNDGVKVWINGKQVLNRPVSRKAEPNQDQFTVHLPKGENTILVKVDQLKRAWGFYFSEN
jgi:hypothetical protein